MTEDEEFILEQAVANVRLESITFSKEFESLLQMVLENNTSLEDVKEQLLSSLSPKS